MAFCITSVIPTTTEQRSEYAIVHDITALNCQQPP